MFLEGSELEGTKRTFATVTRVSWWPLPATVEGSRARGARGGETAGVPKCRVAGGSVISETLIDVCCSTWFVLSLLNQFQDDVTSVRDAADLGDVGTDKLVMFHGLK